MIITIHKRRIGTMYTSRWDPKRWVLFILIITFIVMVSGCCNLCYRMCPKPWEPSSGLELQNSYGKRVDHIEIGQTINVGLRNLESNRSYKVKLIDEKEQMVSYYQLTSNKSGIIEPSPVWYHTGVIGCSRFAGKPQGIYRFQTFEEARKALSNRIFYLIIQDSEGNVIGRQSVPVLKEGAKPQPLIYFSNADGCLMNSYIEKEEDIYITGEIFPPGATISIFLVPNRYGWRPGMELNDVRSEFREKPQNVKLKNGQTSFTESVWKKGQSKVGSYDAVIRVNNRALTPVLLTDDIVSYIQDTGMLVQFAYYPPWAPNDFDIAGRLDKNYGYPYFEFHDVFSVGEEMWGSVDPAMVPADHPGGTCATYYVVKHGTATSGLVDETEGLETMPVKAACINVPMTRIWNNPTADKVGEYDVIVDFGATTAGSKAEWVADNTFNAGMDFIDRATTVGAYIVNDPAAPGIYSVLNWEYKPDPANPSDPLWTDVSSYFNSPYSSVPYTMDHVPLHGIAYYPNGTGPFPLVLIVHGNHLASETSEPGYVYLCELLASHGIIAVTIDENFLNQASGEMDARAIILLRHLQRWRDWNNTPGNTFYNKVDMNKIGLAGHSRGGEAITVAWLFNSTLHNPSDVNHNFNFGIKSLFAIAPVDGQIYSDDTDPVTPGIQHYSGTPVILQNVDYIVMHGSHDGDVSGFSGQKTFDRAHPVTSVPTASKSLLWVYGANHAQWNTVWAQNEDPHPVGPTSHIYKDSQQAIGKVYMSSFYQMTLRDKKEYQALFTGDLTFNSLPSGVTLVHQYQDKDRIFLNHYEEDNNLATGSYTGVTNDNPGNSLNPYLYYAFSDNGSPYWLWQQTDGLIAGWTNASAEYVITLPSSIGTLVDTYPYLSFRVGQIYEPTPSMNTAGANQDFSVQLELGAVNSHTLKVSNFDMLPYPQKAIRDGTWDVSKSIMKTVRIPLRSFVVNQSSWDLHNLSRIQFNFDQKPTGLVAIDEIELTK